MDPVTMRRIRHFLRLFGITTDAYRRTIKMIITLCVMHMIVLLAGHLLLLQPGYFNTANSIWGLVWVLLLAFGIWWFGGVPLDTTLAASLEVEGAKKVVNIIAGFLAIETLINMAFAFMPAGSFKFLAAALSAALSTLLVRYMLGATIDWKRWQILPLANLAICIAVMYYDYYVGRPPSPADSSFWYFAAVAALFLSGFHARFSLATAALVALVGVGIDMGALNFVIGNRPVSTEARAALKAQNKRELKKKTDEIVQRATTAPSNTKGQKGNQLTIEQATAEVNAAELEALRKDYQLSGHMDENGLPRHQYYGTLSSVPEPLLYGAVLLFVGSLAIIGLGKLKTIKLKGESHDVGHSHH